MNIKELKKTKISDLSPEQVESRIEFLLTLSDEEILKYLTYSLDVEYSSDSKTPENDKVKDFIADYRFERFRQDLLFSCYGYEIKDDYNEVEKVLSKVKLAKEKLNKK